MSASSLREYARRWTGRLAHFRDHGNAEHLEALTAEAFRYVGMQLEIDLASSDHWSAAPLSRRVALLLFLVDRGVVARVARGSRVTFEAQSEAVSWVLSQPSLVPYLIPSLEFIAAIQAEQARRPRPARP